jgi:hypothetical protein
MPIFLSVRDTSAAIKKGTARRPFYLHREASVARFIELLRPAKRAAIMLLYSE